LFRLLEINNGLDHRLGHRRRSRYAPAFGVVIAHADFQVVLWGAIGLKGPDSSSMAETMTKA
jgi:hypothetical protein